MNSGDLRHRIEIQTFAETKDEHGGAKSTWTTDVTRWGSVEPLTGRELFNAQQVNSDVTHKVRMRYYSGLTAQHRLKLKDRILNIKAVLNKEERNIELEVLCTEGEPNA